MTTYVYGISSSINIIYDLNATLLAVNSYTFFRKTIHFWYS